MKYSKLVEIEKRAKAGEEVTSKEVLALVQEIYRLEKKANTWTYSDGTRHPLDMD
jgi:hypothetical protein